MKKVISQTRKQLLRKKRVRAKIFRGGVNRPRLCVSKTNKHLFLQIIDDLKGFIHKQVKLSYCFEGNPNKKRSESYKFVSIAKELIRYMIEELNKISNINIPKPGGITIVDRLPKVTL